jgi:hypothetical protein
MRTATGFHPDQARRKVREERQYLTALQLLPEHGCTVFVHTMHLEELRCDVYADSCNLHLGRSFRSVAD